MKHTRSLHHGMLALSLSMAVFPSWASDDCEAPVNRWQTREALQQWASAKGWQISRLKIDDGCYEIRGTDAQGRTFKAKINPETLKVLKLKQDDKQRSRDRDRGDEDVGQQAQPKQADGVSTASPVWRPGSATRGQIP